MLIKFLLLTHFRDASHTKLNLAFMDKKVKARAQVNQTKKTMIVLNHVTGINQKFLKKITGKVII